MQAKISLTQDQQRTLESVYTFLRGVTIYLTAHKYTVCAEDEPQLSNLLNFGMLCLSRLTQAFPEVEEFERRGSAK